MIKKKYIMMYSKDYKLNTTRIYKNRNIFNFKIIDVLKIKIFVSKH